MKLKQFKRKQTVQLVKTKGIEMQIKFKIKKTIVQIKKVQKKTKDKKKLIIWKN